MSVASSNIELLADESYRVVAVSDLLPGSSPGKFAYTRIDRTQKIIWASLKIPLGSRHRIIENAKVRASGLVSVPVHL